MIKNTSLKIKNQELKRNFLPILQIVSNPLLLNSYSRAFKSVLNTLIYLTGKYRSVTISQQKLARLSGVTRQWVNNLIAKMKELGLIMTEYRHMTTCVYYITQWFDKSDVISSLRFIFSSLKAPLMLSLLICLSNRANHEKLTQEKITNHSLFLKLKGKTTNNPCIGDYVSSIQNQNTDGWTNLYKKIKTGEVMIDYKISEVAQHLKSMKLTKWGQIRLSAFPDSALEWADSIMSKRGAKKDPFTYFWKLCLEYCKDRGLTPDWQLTRRLSEYFQMPDNAQLFEKFEEKRHNQHDYGYEQTPKRERHDQAPKAKPSVQPQGFKTVTPEHMAPYNPQASTNFTQRCTLDHVSELEILLSEKGVQQIKKLGMVVGEQGARDFYNRMIDNHHYCLNTNHDQLQQKKKEFVI